MAELQASLMPIRLTGAGPYSSMATPYTGLARQINPRLQNTGALPSGAPVINTPAVASTQVPPSSREPRSAAQRRQGSALPARKKGVYI